MKALVETTGNFGLTDIYSRQTVSNRRPSVVQLTQFLQERESLRQLRVLCPTLSDDATDDEFASYLKESDGDMELAVDSFLSKYDTGSKVPTTKKSGRRAAAEG